MLKKIDFVCVGTQKAGTTTLHNILKEHTDIFLPQKKEAHFFDNEERYNLGLDWWDNEFFSNYNNEKLKGVITPDYLYYKEVPERLFDAFGENLKIIIILRNPVNRAFSHYLMSKRRGFEELSFEKAILNEKKRIIKGNFEKMHNSYIDRGLYYDQLLRYFKLFKKENILLLNFEKDIVQNIDETVLKIQTFLEITNVHLNTSFKSNKASDAKFKIVNTILNKNSLLKHFLKKLLFHSKFRLKLKKFIKRKNRVESKESLTPKFKEVILQKYFLKDIKKTELQFNINLSHWY